jgi:hypothetical protein
MEDSWIIYNRAGPAGGRPRYAPGGSGTSRRNKRLDCGNRFGAVSTASNRSISVCGRASLAKARAVVSAGVVSKTVSAAPALVPVVLKSGSVADTVRRSRVAGGKDLSVNVTLPNAITVTVQLSSVRTLSPPLSELAQLPC